MDRRLGGPQVVWTQRLVEKSFISAGDRTPVVQSVDKTLYWLSYPSSVLMDVNDDIQNEIVSTP
jgi:hypothetical protein